MQYMFFAEMIIWQPVLESNGKKTYVLGFEVNFTYQTDDLMKKSKSTLNWSFWIPVFGLKVFQFSDNSRRNSAHKSSQQIVNEYIIPKRYSIEISNFYQPLKLKLKKNLAFVRHSARMPVQ